jgi:signal transduction histidine kinase
MSAPGLHHADAVDRFDEWLEGMRRWVTGFSVRTKILGIVLALTIALGLVITWQVRSSMSDVLFGELDNRGLSVASDLAARTGDSLLINDSYAAFELLRDTVLHHPDVEYAFIADSRGIIVAHTFGEEGFPIGRLGVHEEVGSEPSHVHFTSELGRIHDFAAPVIEADVGMVRVGLSETRLRTVVDGITTQLLATTFFVAVAGVVAATFLTWLLTRPIIDLVETTRSVGEGDLAARANHWAEDEIGDLSTAFNEMVDDLEANRATIAANEAARSRLLEQLISAQEEERKRLARELHDTVGQALSSIMVGVALLAKDQADAERKSRSLEIQKLTQETLEQVRELSRELRPSALDDLGLGPALARYAEEFQVRYPRLAVDLHVDLPDRLAPSVETTLYRVVQEAMTNAARHSGGDSVSVLLSRRNGSVLTIVEDDGGGFDFHTTRVNGMSVGIHGMQERVEMLGGRLEIESGGDGTTLYAQVPL